MKRFFALILTITMLLTMAACNKQADTSAPEPEEWVTIYLLTSINVYQENVLVGQSDFTYDEKGRPLEVNWVKDAKEIMSMRFAYDPQGNLTRSERVVTYNGKEIVNKVQERVHTYEDGKMTRFTYPSSQGEFGGNVEYDSEGRVTLVQYDRSEMMPLSGYYEWYYLDYDHAGRMTLELCCMVYTNEEGEVDYYDAFGFRYSYDQTGNLTEYRYVDASAQRERPVPGDVDKLELQETDYNWYTFSYDSNGKLERVENERGAIFQRAEFEADSSYTFDEHGNLLSVEKNGVRAEYTYTAVELTKQDAAVAKRMHHGANMEMLYDYVPNAPAMIPLHWEALQGRFYTNESTVCPVYYWIDYPQWNIPL